MFNKIYKYIRNIVRCIERGKDKDSYSHSTSQKSVTSKDDVLHCTNEQEIITKLRKFEIQYSKISYINKIISDEIKQRIQRIEDWRESWIIYGHCSTCGNLTVNFNIYKNTIPTDKDTFIKISECEVSLCPHCKTCEDLKYKEISNPQEIVAIRKQIKEEEEMARQFELNYYRIMSGELPIDLSDLDAQELASYSKAKHREEEYLFLRDNNSLKEGNIKAICISNQDSMTGIKEELEIGETYMIDFIIIGSSYTHVYLSAFPDKAFNYLLFTYYQDDEKFFLNKDYKELRIIDPDIFTRTTLIIYRDLPENAIEKIKQKYNRLVVVKRSDILGQLYTD